MINESLLNAICLLLLVGLLYKKVRFSLQQYLGNYVNNVRCKIDEAIEINNSAQKLFLQAQEELENLRNSREVKLQNAQNHANKIRAQYVADIDKVLVRKSQEYKDFLKNLQANCLVDSKAEVAELVNELLFNLLKSEQLSLSNELN
jgi:F0F1-type ATP synthase membrane subunit b/b'